MPFWQDLARYGDGIAFVDDKGATLTYRDLATGSNLFAGLPARKPLLLALDNSLAAMAAYVEALRVGLPVILINAGDPEAAERIVETFQPSAVWTPDGKLETRDFSSTDCHPDLAIMLSTSGSTGATKLVRLSAAAVDANARAISAYLGLGSDERPITTITPGYSYGLSVINSHRSIGATTSLNQHSVSEPAFGELLERERATSLAGVPYTYELLERAGLLAAMPASLRTLTQAGGKLAPDRVAAIAAAAHATGRRFFVMYGQTEATARMASLPPEALTHHADCIGRPIPGGAFMLVDPETGAIAERAGELVYSGPNVMMGYAETAADLARGQETTSLHTGDLAERVAPDLYRITGRKSRFLKLFGLRIALDQVELLLREANLTGVATGDDQLLVVALLKGNRRAAEAIIDTRLGLPSGSRIVVPLDEIPRLPSGKPDFVALLAIGRAAWAEENSTAGHDWLRAAFRRGLNRSEVQAEDSFSSLAGDSLAYVTVSMAIEQELGFLPDQWEHLTIGEIEARAAETGEMIGRRFRWVSTEMVIRPLAMLLIVTAHGLGAVGEALHGGALTLLMTAGYNSNRFQRDRMLQPGRWEIAARFFVRLIIPYYLILALYHASSRNHIGWRSVALVTNYWRDPGIAPNSMVQFWFIQALFHCIVVMLLLFQIPPVRRYARRVPWHFGLAMVIGAALLRLALSTALPTEMVAHSQFRTDAWAYAFALGWLANEADTPARKGFVVASGYLLSALAWGYANPRVITLTCAGAAILFVPRIKCWTPLASGIAFLAQATFFIYLTQGLAISIVRERLHVQIVPVMVALAVLFGSLAFLGWQVVLRMLGSGFANRTFGRLRPRLGTA